MVRKVRGIKKGKKAARKKLKKAPRHHVYNPQTGKISGRAAHAMPRLEELTKKYMDEGLPAEQAPERARAELRAHSRGDWRGG